MYVQTGKTFITTLIAVVLALGGLALLSSASRKSEPTTLAQTNQSAQGAAAPSAYESSANTSAAASNPTSFEEGYRSGYRDGHQDCATTQNTSSVRRTSYTRGYAPRTRVAGATYYAPARRGHSTRNMILRIAAPAAIGAGIGAIARGGKGAGIGALLGGGGGALYHLIKHGRD
jgi:Tfp pilus assembly protein PilV